MQTKAQIISQIQQITETLGLLYTVTQAQPEYAAGYEAGIESLVESRRGLHKLLASGQYIGLHGKG